MNRKKSTTKDVAEEKPVTEGGAEEKKSESPKRAGNGGWQKIEELREKAALKASLADVWDEDFDLDEEILAELDHKAEFFTTQEEEPEEIPGDDEEIDEIFDDDEV